MVSASVFWYAQALLQRAREAGLRARAGNRLLNDWVWAVALQQILGCSHVAALRCTPRGQIIALAALSGENESGCAIHRHTVWHSAALWRASTAIGLDQDPHSLSLHVFASPKAAAAALGLRVEQKWIARLKALHLSAGLQRLQAEMDRGLQAALAGGQAASILPALKGGACESKLG